MSSFRKTSAVVGHAAIAREKEHIASEIGMANKRNTHYLARRAGTPPEELEARCTGSIDRLVEFMAAPYGRRLLVHGYARGLADDVRQAACRAGIALIEIDARETPIDDLIRHIETLDQAGAPAVILIDRVERYRRVPRADWRIRGTTQHAQHLGLVMTIHRKSILWITDPKAGFYGQLAQHAVR